MNPFLNNLGKPFRQHLRQLILLQELLGQFPWIIPLINQNRLGLLPQVNINFQPKSLYFLHSLSRHALLRQHLLITLKVIADSLVHWAGSRH
jgi:hypothetical protein